MGKKIKMLSGSTVDIVLDGNLTRAEALWALRTAAQVATKTLYEKLDNCKTQSERNKLQDARDEVVLSYRKSLKKSLICTGPLFENAAGELGKTAADVKLKVRDLQNVIEVINLLTGLVRLAASLALAFG